MIDHLENIQQRGNKFVVDVTKNGKRQRVTCGSVEEAINVRGKLERMFGCEAGMAKPECWTIGEAFERVTEAIWKGKPSERNSVRNGGFAVGFFGAKTPLDEITGDWVDGYIARLKQMGNSGGTINRKLAALSKIISHAHQRNKCARKPHMQRQRESQGRIRFITQDEERIGLQYLSQWSQDDHAEAFCILVDTGMRPSELWRLEGRDLNFENGVITVWETKNGQSRSVPMTTRVKEIMHRRAELTISGPLFAGCDNYWMARMWERMRCAMGLQNDEQFIPYALRHTCASRLVQRGVALKVVQEWMAHKT